MIEKASAARSELTLAQMQEEMDQALTDEINKLSKFKPIKHSAVDGKLLSEGNGQYIYQFTLTEPWEPQDDGQLSIASESTRGIICTVVTSVGTTLTIVSESLLPPDALRQIDLYDDSTELLKRLKEALSQVDEGSARLGSKCFKLLPSEQKSHAGAIQCGTFQLRPRQLQAARLALGGEVTFIVGPPGTGKTSTLAAIALTHLQAGQTVLIAAHTNIAIDNAIMKLCELCKEAKREDLLAHGQVVRYGAVQKEELKQNDFYKEVYLPKIARHLGSELHTQHEQLKVALATLDGQITAWQQKEQAEDEQRRLEDHRAQLVTLQKELAPLEQAEARRMASLREQQDKRLTALAQLTDDQKYWSRDLARTEAAIMEQEQALAEEQQGKDVALKQLVDARAMNGLKRFLKRIKLEELEVTVALAGQSVDNLERSLQDLKERRSAGYQRLKDYQQQKQAAEAALSEIQRALNTPTEAARKISLLKGQLKMHQKLLTEMEALLRQRTQSYQQQSQHFLNQRAQIEAQLAEIAKRLRDLEKGIVEKARVIGTTLTKTYINQVMINKRFDAVILDEVSMAPLPLVYIAASHADRSVTLIGDPQQLAPIVSAETEMAKKWLGNDLFSLRGVSLATASEGREQSVMLDVQSRMHPAISIIANRWIYGGKLRDDFSAARHRKITPLPEAPLVLCDTHDASPTVSRPPNGKSRKNYYHALCSLALARRVLESTPEIKQKAERSIGIVTPYRPQAQLLQSLIKDAGLQAWMQAGTVHRFQGLEFDVVIFDTVESPGLAPGDFISGAWGSDSMRLINVAVTRPRQKLYIVANLPHLQSTLPAQSTLRLAVEEAAGAAVLPSLDVAGTPFPTLIKELRDLSPAFDPMQAALDGTLFSHISPGTYKHLVENEVLVFKPAEIHPLEKPNEAEIHHFTEKTFYEAFQKDVANARQSICIASPYLAEARLNRILPQLVAQKNHGIRLEIFTRPLDESDEWDRKAVERVLAEGIQPEYKAKMHEKATIIDEEIMYHGSLNALSHRDTTESILRITNRRIIKEVDELIRSSSPSSLSAEGDIHLDDDAYQRLPEIVVLMREVQPTKTCACGKPLKLKQKNDGTAVFFGCSDYKHCRYKSSESLSSAHLQALPIIIENQLCKQCGSPIFIHVESQQHKLQRVLLVCKESCGTKLRISFR